MLEGLPPEECLRRANALLHPECPDRMFITALVGRLDLRTGDLAYSTAGHYPPILLPAKDTPQALESTGGIGLCLLPQFHYESRHVTLSPGDGVFLYTDGLSEARNRGGEMFGDERIAPSLAQIPGASAADVISHVNQAVEIFSTGVAQSDDLTTLLVRYTAGLDKPTTVSVMR